MLNLYYARLAHIESLTESPLLEAIEVSLFKKTAVFLRKLLKIQDSDITSEHFVNRIIQSSRDIHIGNEEKPVSNEERAVFALFLKDFVVVDSSAFFTVSEMEVSSDSIRSFSIKSEKHKLEVKVSFTPYKDESLEDFGMRNHSLEYQVDIYVINWEEIHDGYGFNNHTPMIRCVLGRYALTEVYNYLGHIDAQGLRVNQSMWMAHGFDDDDAMEIIYKIIPSDCEISEWDLRVLRLHTDNTMLPNSFDGFATNLEEPLEKLCHNLFYLMPEEECVESRYGFRWGKLIVTSLLMTCLEMADDDKKIQIIAENIIIHSDDICDSIIDEVNESLEEAMDELWCHQDNDEEMNGRVKNLKKYLGDCVREREEYFW